MNANILHIRRPGLALTCLALLALSALALCGCESMGSVTEVGTTVATGTGFITPQEKQALDRTGHAIGKASEDLTPEQEYWIGRTVGAMVTDKYGVYDNDAATAYLNQLGQTLAVFSDRPETFKGYHFLVLNSDEINAFAAPGGFIFVSKGMIRCCKDEDDLAAVLAHEIGHVQNKDGLNAISTSRWKDVGATVLAESAKVATGGRVSEELMGAFTGCITDITGTMFVNGYSRKQERHADEAAVVILQRSGYNPHGLVRMLQEMDKRLKPGGADFAKTHPKPTDRISDIRSAIKGAPDLPTPAVRVERFQKAVGSI